MPVPQMALYATDPTRVTTNSLSQTERKVLPSAGVPLLNAHRLGFGGLGVMSLQPDWEKLLTVPRAACTLL